MTAAATTLYDPARELCAPNNVYLSPLIPRSTPFEKHL